MSIEHQLKKEFQVNSKNVVCPSSVDSQMKDIFRKYREEGQRETRVARKWKPSYAAIIAVLFVLLSGFAYAGGKLLFQENNGNVSISVTAFEKLNLEQAKLNKISHALSDVKVQLKSGETAVVYFADLEKEELFRKLPLLPVAKPEVTTNLDAWKTILSNNNIANTLPDTLLGTFRFAEGMEGGPFGPSIGPEAGELLKEMKAESKKTGQDVLWRRTAAPLNMPIEPFTSVYRNKQQETIYVTVESVKEKVDVKLMTPDSTKYDELDINGSKAHYFKNENFLFFTSQFYQEISWVEGSGTATTIRRVGSDSPAVTKEQLAEAAKAIK